MQDTYVVSDILEPYQLEVHDMLCSGWSPARVYRHLEIVRRVKVPLQDLNDFLISIPPSEILPKTQLQKEFDGADIEVDAIGEMARLLRLQAERLGVGLLLEQREGERLPYVDVASQVYWKMLKDYIDAKQAAGELPLSNVTSTLVTLDTPMQKLPMLRDLIIINNAAATAAKGYAAAGDGDDDDDVIEGEVEISYPGGPQSYVRAPSK